MKMMALLAVVMLTGCEAQTVAPVAPEAATPPTIHATPAIAAVALTTHSLVANSLPEMQLLATPEGRDVVSQVVSCALPAGTSITAITRDGTPYSFSGSFGLAPAWAARAPTASERHRVIDCVHAHTAGLTSA